MNKTDKLLYGGFAVIIVAGIVAMLVSVFSPLKQTEETVEIPKATLEKQSAKQIEDVPNQMERWRQGVENARLQREAEEETAMVIQAERDTKEQAEKEWRESRKEWIERFPFEPTPHPEITHDPDVYDPVSEEEWPEEKAELYSKMASIVDNHTFLKGFYKSKLPYTEEFEQMYDIVKEELGEELHPIPLAKAFETIKDYHKAAQREPDSVFRKNVRVRRPMPKQEPVIIAVKNLPPEGQATLQSMSKQEHVKTRAVQIHDGNCGGNSPRKQSAF